VKIRVKLSRTNDTKEIDLNEGATVEELLKKLRLKPDTTIAISNNTPIPVDDILNNGQEILVIQVSSGG
jgi:sulfur carrier protein ThiS